MARWVWAMMGAALFVPGARFDAAQPEPVYARSIACTSSWSFERLDGGSDPSLRVRLGEPIRIGFRVLYAEPGFVFDLVSIKLFGRDVGDISSSDDMSNPDFSVLKALDARNVQGRIGREFGFGFDGRASDGSFLEPGPYLVGLRVRYHHPPNHPGCDPGAITEGDQKFLELVYF